MSDILIVQNTPNEGIGTLGVMFEADGFRSRTILAKKEAIPAINPSAIVILGAPESANDDLKYLKDELVLIRDAVKKDIPLLGICLGSQLIAKAFGARVFKGEKMEIGFYHDIEFDTADGRSLLRGFQSPATVFHWHGDTFDLPETGRRLAHSPNYPNQALRVGSAIGLQFHLEVSDTMIRSWLKKSEDDLRTVPYILPDKIIEEIPKHLESVQKNMQTFYQNFKLEFNL